MLSIETGTTFCILPWIHFNLQTNGDIYSCCDIQRNEDSNLGNIHDVSIEDIWNHHNIRNQRIKMLKNEKVNECLSCYKTESTGCTSKRQRSNEMYKKYIMETKLTLSDGSVEKINLRDIAFHFSNLCNYRCRTCGPESSSSWAIEIKNILPSLYKKNLGYKKYNRKSLIWKKLEKHVNLLEKVYFAGGEPLINHDHFYFLQHLIEKEMFHVNLVYNTNFSTLKYNSHSLTDIWKKFKNVYLSISLDCHGLRGEYIRKGLKWSEIFQRRKELETECPHIQTEVSATLSVFNALQIPDFHSELVNNNFILPTDFLINYLFEPSYFSAQILPREIKNEVSKKYADYILTLNRQKNIDKIDTTSVQNSLNSILNFIFENDSSHLLPDFFENVSLIDKSRSENFEKIFPELAHIKYT